jgi:hypothetical protein
MFAMPALSGVLITPLPCRDPSQLVVFRADLPGLAHAAASSGW